jgi:hypothetical protein
VVLLVACRVGQWEWWAAVSAGIYFAYLLADVFAIRQSVVTRAIRNFSPLVALAVSYPSLMRVIAPLTVEISRTPSVAFGHLPKLVAWALVDWWFFCYLLVLPYVVWAMVEYYFKKYLQFQRFLRGLFVTLYLTLLAVMLVPSMRSDFPLAVEAGQRGLYVRFLEWVNPMSGLKLLLLPGIFVALSAFTLAFDFAHNRRRFWAFAFFVVNAWLSAIVLRGYPLQCVAWNFLTVAVVFAYINVFKFRAHDGRRI